MQLLLRLLVLSCAVYGAYSLCNACRASTGSACVANNMFKVCVNGLPTGEAMACPDGTVCSETDQICTPVGSVPAACGACGECNGTNTFACTGYTTFALCYGTSTPLSANYSCTGSLVCNVDSPTMCIDPLTTGVGGTCPSVAGESSSSSTTSTTAATLTTPNPALNPAAYCAWKGAYGRFDVTADTTCRTYIFCVLNNGAWNGVLLQCVGQTLFNATSGLCQVGTPARCAANVTRLVDV